MITAADRKAFSDAVDAASDMGLMLCAIYNPAFNHFFIEMKTPDTQEPMGQSISESLDRSAKACTIEARQRLELLGVEKYVFQKNEKPSIIIAT